MSRAPDVAVHQATVALEVLDERRRQDRRWGVQDHPALEPGSEEIWLAKYRQQADWWKERNGKRVAAGTLAWDGILREEVYEALSESDEDRLREELIQVAAVAQCWIEAIDRRRRRLAPPKEAS